ncbi:cobalamin biosynthesis protein [Saccharopolyspora sp. NPDC047091]|uniref:cobalamin biosynthesis protein n=1 Tax=Saccharopolyspora sp. NPDC047091 TaxID=3155924 RepID=UPI0033DFF50C
MIGLFPHTPQERRTATELAARWGPDAVLVDGGPGPALRRTWSSLDAVVLFLPVGAAVRLIAPLLGAERADPEVVCVDDHFAVTVSGGSRAIAVQVAEVLERTPVVTTGAAVTELDELVDHLGATVDGDLAGCAQAIAAEEPVLLANPRGFALPALPATVSPDCGEPSWTVLLDDRRPTGELGDRVVRLIPRTLLVGVGSMSGVSRTAVTELMSRLDREYGFDPRAIGAFATVEAKAAEQGVLDAVEDLGFWYAEDGAEPPLFAYPAAELAEVDVPNPSERARAETGTASVAEAAALRVAHEFAARTADDVELVVPKQAGDGVTVAAARLRPRGEVTVVGIGPGPEDLRTPLGNTTIRRAAAVVGDAAAMALVGDLVHPGAITRTVESAAEGALAVAELATGGRSAVFVGSGDATPERAAVQAEPACRAVRVADVPGVRA